MGMRLFCAQNMENTNPNFVPGAVAPTGAEVRRDAKRWGDLAELKFTVKAASLGICVSKPYGDRRPYDFLAECGPQLWRVQVKSVFTVRPDSHRLGFPIASSRNRRGERASYTAEQIDFIAAFVGPHDAWYVIPVDAIITRKFIRLYPGGRRRRGAGLFEEYREAWHLMTAVFECSEDRSP